MNLSILAAICGALSLLAACASAPAPAPTPQQTMRCPDGYSTVSMRLGGAPARQGCMRESRGL